jgi:iron complex transport system ATP-binding protein
MELAPHIEFKDIAFGYAQKTVIDDISLRIKHGDIVSILGPNGSGKTTLLKLLLGILQPRAGEVFIDGKPVSRMTPKALSKIVAYVPQAHRAAFAYEVIDMVLMGRSAHKSFFYRYSEEDHRIAESFLERLSIIHLKNRYYTEISGGERQLTLIARALAQGARTLVMDEPANGLDYGNQLRLLEHISDLSKDGYTFIQSTHFPEHSLWVADHVILLRNGKILSQGKPDTVIDSEAINSLYNTRVKILTVQGRLKMCVPQSILPITETSEEEIWRPDPRPKQKHSRSVCFVADPAQSAL